MWKQKFFTGLLILILLVLLGVNIGMRAMKFSDEDAMEYFQENKFFGEIKNIVINGRSVKIVVEELQESDSILVVFVHGAPGTWDAFKSFVVDEDLKRTARIIAYDRPGYGGSGSQAMPSIREQSNILKKILEIYGLRRIILVGHSYGGPIVGRVALDRESETDVAIMIAPLIDPDSEPLFWYAYFSYWKLTSWLLPTELVVAGSEKFAHSQELELMKDQWRNAKCSFIHIHGLEDGLAPAIENLDFTKKHIPNQQLKTMIYEDKGHLLMWTDFNLMKDMILKATNQP